MDRYMISFHFLTPICNLVGEINKHPELEQIFLRIFTIKKNTSGPKTKKSSDLKKMQVVGPESDTIYATEAEKKMVVEESVVDSSELQ